MDPAKWTEKTSSALSAAAEAAAEAGNAQIEPLHVAAALLSDKQGVAGAAVLRAARGDEAALASLRRTLQAAVSRLPAVRGGNTGQPSASNALSKVLSRCASRMKARGDTFLAVDVLWGECLNDNKVRSWSGLVCIVALLTTYIAGGGGCG
jgi:ATP-dependent Clp protease ATP-binding subunit ClpB